MDWFAVLADNKYERFDEPIKEYDCSYWVHIIDTGRTYTTSYKTVYRINKYAFFDNKLTAGGIKIKGWEIVSAKDPDKKHGYNYFICLAINDPTGHVKFDIFTELSDINGAIFAIEKLKELSNYTSWKEFDACEENSNLKSENESLNKELNNLKSKIEAINSTRIFIKTIAKFKSLKPIYESLPKQQAAKLIKSLDLNMKFYNLWLKDLKP